jgi:hypothetical protein
VKIVVTGAGGSIVSTLGERYTHGHVLDFHRQLREHPSIWMYARRGGT